MNVEDERFEEWETAFNAVAEGVPEVPAGAHLANAQRILCLYGDNGYAPEEEFEQLAYLQEHRSELKKIILERDYWMDTILFIP